MVLCCCRPPPPPPTGHGHKKMVCSLAGSFILSFVRSFVLAVNRNEMKHTLKGIQVKLRLLRLHLLLLLGLIVKCRAQHFGASVRSFVRSFDRSFVRSFVGLFSSLQSNRLSVANDRSWTGMKHPNLLLQGWDSTAETHTHRVLHCWKERTNERKNEQNHHSWAVPRSPGSKSH